MSEALNLPSEVPEPPAERGPVTTAGLLEDYRGRAAKSLAGGSGRSVERQHAKGKLTARERLDLLLDPGSFVEVDALARSRPTGVKDDDRVYGDGVITGHGTVEGRQVCVFAQDFTVYGGSLGEVFGSKIIKIMDLAAKIGCPMIGLNDSGGARIQEGVTSLAYYAEIGRRNARMSGVVPQLSLILGPCAGGAVYSPAITDFTIMVEEISHMFVTGPDVVQAVLGQRTSYDELGGGEVNSSVSGNAHYLARDEKDAFDWVRTLLSFLPANSMEDAPLFDTEAALEVTDADRELDVIIPDARQQGYDMQDVVRHVLDDREFLQVQPDFGRSIMVGFGRVNGQSVGVVANQPLVNAGTLDIDASEKAARFVRFCDAFNIAILTFADVPGYMPGVEQERLGIIRRGAKMIYAYCEATVPMVTVVTRKAYGGGYAVMGSKHVGADVNLAWPTAEIAVMGGAGAVNILNRPEIEAARAAGTETETRARLIDEYHATMATPYVAAERGYIDAVIEPSRTRLEVGRALHMLRGKRETLLPRKHGNIPL